jgi:ABC-type nitrate/sulfonate/bicarbonate transport system ATPase subunit
VGHIRIESVCKGYRQKPVASNLFGLVRTTPPGEARVLERINLEFLPGEMVCILGLSGCGKTTLLRLLAGFEAPSSGRVVIDGLEVTGPSSDHIFMFQHNSLFPWLNVGENVAMAVRRAVAGPARDAIVRACVEMVGLQGFESAYPHELSGGMMRRAELARSLGAEPDTFFLDEPFSALDYFTHVKMRDEVLRVQRLLRKTMVVVTHDVDDALFMGDRVVVLGDSPATVKVDRVLAFPHPRDFGETTELARLKETFLDVLGERPSSPEAPAT